MFTWSKIQICSDRQKVLSAYFSRFREYANKNYRKELAVGDNADESDPVSVAVEGVCGDAVDLTEAAKEEGQTN